ncbi:MAG: ACT domain-containing protein, partial [Anaerolineales bacterium]
YLKEEGLARVDDLYGRLGFGKLEARQVLARVVGEERLGEPAEAAKPGLFRQAVSRILPLGGEGPITVKGQGDMLAYLAKCCNPLPGEEIVGYVTRGRGVSVHSRDCTNVKNLLYNPEREIEVQWAKQKDDVYQISLTIETADQPGMLARLTEAIAKADSNITQIEADTREIGRGQVQVVVELRNRKHLDKLLREVRAVAGVLRVDRRMTGGTKRAEAFH